MIVQFVNIWLLAKIFNFILGHFVKLSESKGCIDNVSDIVRLILEILHDIEVLSCLMKFHTILVHLREMRRMLICFIPFCKEFPALIIVLEPQSHVFISTYKLKNVVHCNFHPFIVVLIGMYCSQESFEPIIHPACEIDMISCE